MSCRGWKTISYLNASSYNSHLNYSKEMDQCIIHVSYPTSKVAEANDGVLKVLLLIIIILYYIGSGECYIRVFNVVYVYIYWSGTLVLCILCCTNSY